MKGFKLYPARREIQFPSSLWGVLIALFLVFIASSCTTLPYQAIEDSQLTTIVIEPASTTSNIQATDFNILGRLSVQTEQERSSGSFRWQHLSTGDEILIFTSLGQAVAEITRDSEGVRLITSKLDAFYATDVESLTEEILGWRLPLDGLQYWIQGVHSPTTVAEKDLNQENQVVAIRQNGWNIQYVSYTSASVNQITLPRLLNLSYEDLRIRLIVDNWNVK